MAQWEWESIREKSIAGQVRARAEGRPPGRPVKDLTPAMQEIIERFLADGYSRYAISRLFPVTRHQVDKIARRCNE